MVISAAVLADVKNYMYRVYRFYCILILALRSLSFTLFWQYRCVVCSLASSFVDLNIQHQTEKFGVPFKKKKKNIMQDRAFIYRSS